MDTFYTNVWILLAAIFFITSQAMKNLISTTFPLPICRFAERVPEICFAKNTFADLISCFYIKSFNAKVDYLRYFIKNISDENGNKLMDIVDEEGDHIASSNLSILRCAWKNSLREAPVENSKEELDEVRLFQYQNVMMVELPNTSSMERYLERCFFSDTKEIVSVLSVLDGIACTTDLDFFVVGQNLLFD